MSDFGPTAFDAVVERQGATTVIALYGEMDLASEERFLEALATASNGPLVIDLREVAFIDSSGVRLILEQRARQRANGGAPLSVVLGDDGPARRVFDLLELTDAFDGRSPPEDLPRRSRRMSRLA
jgi:anti-anti-sigma factor